MGDRVRFLVFSLLLTFGCGVEKEVVTCTDVCQRALTCLVDGVRRGGDSVVRVEEDEALLMAACTSRCGGIWEPATSRETCAPGRSCTDFAHCLPVPDVGLLSPSKAADLAPFLWRVEEQCSGQSQGSNGCLGLPAGEARSECLVAATCAAALRTGKVAKCASLDVPWSGLCEALGERRVEKCPAADPRLHLACVQFIAGQPATEHGHLFSAIAAQQPALCQPVEGALERRRCQALAAADPGRCPQELLVHESWGKRVGAAFERPSRAQVEPEPPLFLPYLYVILGILAVLLWPWLLLWGHHIVGRLWGLGRTAGALLGAAVVLYLFVRLLAVEGPINFVEYERVFVPGNDDLGRLGYAGWSLIVRPFLRVFGGGYGLLFAVNAGLGLLAIPALASLALRLSGRGDVAGYAALLLASQPAFVRVGASASETLPFASLSIIFFDLLMRWGQLPRRLTLGAGLVLAPLLLVLRPEGVLLGIPALVALLLEPGGLRLLWRGWTPTQRGVALWVAGLFVAAGALYAGLPRPPATWGLFVSNLQPVLLDLGSPWFVSPALLLGGLVAAFALLRVRTDRSLGAAVLVWSLLLIGAWGTQGSEGNNALGATRYAVLWFPWLALALGWGVGRMRGRRWQWGLAAACLAASVPQFGLISARTNLQIEYEFYMSALPEVPPGSLLVLPSAPTDNQEFTPEAAPLAILAVLRQSARWMPLDEAAGAPPVRSESYLLQGFYRRPKAAAKLVDNCRLETLKYVSVTSNPDVGPRGDAPAGADAALGLYRLSCRHL